MTRSVSRRVLSGLGLVAVAIGLFFWWIGYIGGGTFIVFPAVRHGPKPPATVAIVLSGDMGLHFGMAPAIAARLARDGVPVVGVNSLAYFRATRTRRDATALLDQAMQRARAIAPSARLALIGQSYGADMVHVGLAGLPPSHRRAIALVALVVPENSVEFRASPGEIFTFAMSDQPALPTARKLDWAPLICIQGQEERDSLCPLLPHATRIALPGGHPLHHDPDTLYRALRPALVARHLI
ncbi:AcvB/VirJ family lysyl-phosphatidylglycerol hydrolase [Sphingobium ummariense]|uniref:Bacterial virulence domain-containing protein n=1 Tax=Sphingobium ummariense RL-3 TaxID=1346791 RepID=T0JAW2_9SPHN|nr:AcvB/VirJ family lysyl-phosphatidylglycerol hydrolase [Sphingobium ummariense]EQB33982.1 hypothetical protein M529_01270 [Sphingobium ummariense RL-3]